MEEGGVRVLNRRTTPSLLVAAHTSSSCKKQQLAPPPPPCPPAQGRLIGSTQAGSTGTLYGDIRPVDSFGGLIRLPGSRHGTAEFNRGDVEPFLAALPLT